MLCVFVRCNPVPELVCPHIQRSQEQVQVHCILDPWVNFIARVEEAVKIDCLQGNTSLTSYDSYAAAAKCLF
jgi:hypothetical protein